MEELQQQVQALDAQSWQTFLNWIVEDEHERRQAQTAIEQAQAEIITELQDAGKLEKPEAATKEQAKEDAARVPEWRDPGTTHSLMYHYGDVVRYQGKLVRSTHKGLNHWVPGTLGFDGRIGEDITPKTQSEKPTSGTAAWKPGLSVKVGEKYTYNGATYQVIQPHTTQAGWEPSGVPALWKKL
ncbi:carbohydrate-binding protein [Corynebacterium sp. LaCa117]|uniref:carbohydrate-binding protein n=1 Tax=Corynebacterium sp. LaCa117 TaxID=3391424 RepID=UPI00398A0175